MHEISLSTILPAPPDEIRRRLGESATLAHVARGLLSFRPLDTPALPETWAPGRYRVALRLFGVIPAGTQVIGIEQPGDSDAWVVRDNGGGTLFPVWDHRIFLAPAGPDETRYTDTVRFRARLPGPLARGFVHVFYRYRQRRWRRLLAQSRKAAQGSGRGAGDVTSHRS
jgi:hypothetical protein